MTVAVSLFLVSVGVFLFGSRSRRESRVFRRFREVTGYGEEEGEEEVDLDEELLQGTFYERNIYPMLEKVADLIGGDGETKREKLERQLIQAGRLGDLGPNEFIALQVVLGLTSVSLVALVALLLGPTSKKALALSVVFAAGAGLGSYIVPRFYLSRTISKRRQTIKQSLPYAIDLLVVSAEAGLGFDMAMRRVVDKMEGALSDEFRRVLEEIKLGTPRKRALRNLDDRVDVDELGSFVSAIIQAEELGASIGEVLSVQSDQMRTDRRQQIEKKAQQAPVKMLIPMVLFIFPTIFIVILGPVILKVIEQMGDVGGGM